MQNSVLTILLLGMLLMAVIAPFSVLSILMTVVLLSGVAWMGWLLLKTLLFGDSPESTDPGTKG